MSAYCNGAAPVIAGLNDNNRLGNERLLQLEHSAGKLVVGQ